MKLEKIKPIPKKILTAIAKLDEKALKHTRFYSYLTKNDGELCKVTVAVKFHNGKRVFKQVAVHGIHSDRCFVKDMECTYLSGYIVGWYAEGLTKRPKWYESKDWCTASAEYYQPFAPCVNQEYALTLPQFKYSAADLYKGDNIMTYLRTYETYPQTEYLVKLGLSKLTERKQILDKIAKDKKFRKWISVNRIELADKHHYVSVILQAYKQGTPLAELQAYEEAKKTLTKERGNKPILDMLNGDYAPYFAYIAKQKISNGLYLDYLNACLYLGLDMSEDKNRYPHDFHHWHDIRTDEYKTAKALADEKERAELYDRFALIADKYLSLQHIKGDFIAVIAKSPAELVREGDALHHCVGRMGYDQKFVREETLIFFIRTKDAPETSFVTAEYSVKQKKILQCYADHNQRPNEAVMHYVNDIWLPFANRRLSKIAV